MFSRPGVDDFLEEDNGVGDDQIPQHDQLVATPAQENDQIPRPNQLVLTPAQENDIKVEEPEAPGPPPPPEEQDSVAGSAGNDYPTRFWCAFPQRIDADGPPPEIIWNPGDWELPQGTLQSGQGDQVAIRLPDSFPTPQDVPAHGRLLGE